VSDRITSVGENGVATGIFAGYQKIIDGKLYIAAEGFYQYADILIEKEENAFPGNINYFTYIKNSHKSGIVGKVGFVHCNNLFYLKTGIALSHFTLGFKDNGCNICLIPGGVSSTSKLQKGVIVGGGVEYFINKNVGIGMEYEITSYPSMNFKSNNVGSFSFKSTSHTFQVRFKYTL
jgi:opacity protein-like surface antigen